MVNNTTTIHMEKNKPPKLLYRDGSPMRKHKSKIVEELINEDKQQTAMNELLVWVRKTLPMDLDYPRMIEEKIESLIPKEKEQMHKCASFWRGKEGYLEMPIFNQYYNETYGERKQD